MFPALALLMVRRNAVSMVLRVLEAAEEKHRVVTRNTAYCLLQECDRTKDFQRVRQLQHLITHSGLDTVSVLGDHLIRLLAYHGCLFQANQVFNKIVKPSVYTWATIMLANGNLGQGELALQLYERMQLFGTVTDEFTYTAVLKNCTMLRAPLQGRIMHGYVLKSNKKLDVVLGSSLIDMYAKCECLLEARRVFDRLQDKNLVSWGAMIGGYAQSGQSHLAIECFKNMQDEGMTADVVAWGAVITGHIQHGDSHLALRCFQQMQEQGIEPNEVIFSSILKACAILGAIEKGTLIHQSIICCGYHIDAVVGSALVDMYTKCGSLTKAFEVFDNLPNKNLVSWNVMIAGFVHHGEGIEALQCYKQMHLECIKPDGVTFLSVLKACASIGAIEHGRVIHKQITQCNIELDDVVGNTIVDMYAKCGSLGEAHNAFCALPRRDVVSWNAMVAGYAQHGEGCLALECFDMMQQECMMPDELSFTSLLTLCSRAGLVDEGYWYFMSMKFAQGIGPTTSHCTCMVDLLGHAGCLHQAEILLWSTNPTYIRGWMCLLSACRIHGNKEIGKRCFEYLIHLDLSFSAGYVVMSNIYADARDCAF